MIIGLRNEEKIEAVEAVNPHTLVTGITGSGKSVFCQAQIIQRAEKGQRVIAFNYHGVLNREQMLPDIRKQYEKLCHVIHVADGIPLPLFTPFVNSYGKEESMEATVHRVSSLLSVAGSLTEPQTRELSQAVKHVMKKGTFQTEGIKAIAKKLEQIGSPLAFRILGNLRALFEMNAVIDGDLLREDAPIIELDFDGIEYDDQEIIIRLVCDYYLRLAMTMRYAESGITLFIDEIQNFDFGANSTLRSLINEGRKIGVTLLIATPSLFNSGKASMRILNQVGTRIVFKPLDNELRQVADALDNRRRAFLMCELPDLKRGQFIYGVSAKDSAAGRTFDVLETFVPETS